MAGRIVEEAWSGNISGERSDSHFALLQENNFAPEYAKYKNRSTYFVTA
jgi:hypothetical protein